MSTHDELAWLASKTVLKELQGGSASWAVPHLSSTSPSPAGLTTGPGQTTLTTIQQPTEPWPLVQASRSIEARVRNGREVITYLNDYDYGLLVLPQKSLDGFQIASYLRDTAQSEALKGAPLGILAYDKGPDTDPGPDRKFPLRPRQGPAPVTKRTTRRFWGYSPTLRLRLARRHSNSPTRMGHSPPRLGRFLGAAPEQRQGSAMGRKTS